MTLAYLLCLAASLAALAVILRRRPAPTPPPPPPPVSGPAALPVTAADDVRAILTAAAQLATKLDTAA